MATQALVVQTRTITEPTLRFISRLQKRLPDWVDLLVVGYDDQRPGVHRIDDSLSHRLLSHADVDWLRRKIHHDEAIATLIPGNADWLMMWVARQHPEYTHIWWVEDDVRYGGNWRTLLETLRADPADLLTTRLLTRDEDPEWSWWTHSHTPATTEYAAFMPFGRISRAGVEAVRAAYDAGWAGHAEAFVPTAVAAAGLLISDVTDFYTPDSFRHRPFHLPSDVEGDLLWHPVRPRQQQRLRNEHHRVTRARAEASSTAAENSQS